MKNSIRGADCGVSRRAFLHKTGLLTAVAALVQSGWVGRILVSEARAGHGPDLVTDTFNGLAAFIVPGPDPYSVHQGVTDPRPGAVAACTGSFLALTLNLINLAPPPFPGFSDFVAFILNHAAQTVYPTVTGPFDSHFANLSFTSKATVFKIMESGLLDPELVPLAGTLPAFAASIAYSEAGLLNSGSCTISGVPVGWLISSYEGVADGRNDFRGYFQNRRSTT